MEMNMLKHCTQRADFVISETGQTKYLQANSNVILIPVLHTFDSNGCNCNPVHPLLLHEASFLHLNPFPFPVRHNVKAQHFTNPIFSLASFGMLALPV